MAQPYEEVVLGEEIEKVRVITLNRPRQLNVISSKVVSLLAGYLEKWEKDDKAELIIIKGSGRAFSAGGDLKMFYDGRDSRDSCLEVVYRMYWLCYHIHTYKKTQVALVHGISMGGGASLMVPMKFSVVTEKAVFSTPEAGIGFHTDCGFSYMLSHLPGHLGNYASIEGKHLACCNQCCQRRARLTLLGAETRPCHITCLGAEARPYRLLPAEVRSLKGGAA